LKVNALDSRAMKIIDYTATIQKKKLQALIFAGINLPGLHSSMMLGFGLQSLVVIGLSSKL